LALSGEILWACDGFEEQTKNVDGSGLGDKAYFLGKMNDFGIQRNSVRVHTKSSLELPINFTSIESINKFRLFSIDGGHTRSITFNDLTVASENLVEGGIMVVDDVPNLDWPGVIDGLLLWLGLTKDEYGPFFVGYNKVFLTQRRYHSTYYRALQQHPFWGKYLISTNPRTSGKNRVLFSWGGYPFLQLHRPPDLGLLKTYQCEKLQLDCGNTSTSSSS